MDKNKEGRRWGVIGLGSVLSVLALTAVANSTFVSGTQTQSQTAAAINATATVTNADGQSVATPVASTTLRSNTQQHKQISAPLKKADDLSNSKTYTNVSGHSVHAPAYDLDSNISSGASARCRDGSYSFSQNHRGTCSHHGGVSQWL